MNATLVRGVVFNGLRHVRGGGTTDLDGSPRRLGDLLFQMC